MHLRFSLFALLCAWSTIVCAQATPLSYTLALPFSPNLATPVWLGHPETPAGTFASLNLPVDAPAVGQSLLVTLFFQEKEGGFLRIIWKGSSGEQELSSNFFEGIGMNNQRTLLIPASVVAGTGTLCLQCGDTTMDVQKVHLEWLEDRTALVSPERSDEEVVSRLGKATVATALDGQAAGASSANLDGYLVTVPLLATPQRIENGVEYSMQLDGPPQAARLSFEEAGLAWNQHLVVWINQKRAGTITPAVPDLGDAGFSPAATATQVYVGWRGASIYLPVALLKSGANSLQVSAENDDPATMDAASDDSTSSTPLAVKEMVCQFDYTPVADAPATTALPATPNASPALPAPLSTSPTLRQP